MLSGDDPVRRGPRGAPHPAFDLGEGEPFAGRFRLEYEVWVGVMGVVYRALDEASGEPVALKVLRPTDEVSVRRFASEAGALERLRHPAVVRYVAYGLSDEGEPFLAMQWLEGESLRARLGRAPLEVGEAVSLGRRLCGALGALHEAGVVHRDVKPSNVMLAGRAAEGAMLIDFGIARSADDPYVTTTGVFVGTPGYLAPEQARGLRGVDGRADLFSLGCVLFRCLTGREPFEGFDALTVVAKLLLHEVPLVGELRPEIPPSLEGLVDRLLAKDPAHRPATAKAVEAELAAVADGLSKVSLPFGTGEGVKSNEAFGPGRLGASLGSNLGGRPAETAAEEKTSKHVAHFWLTRRTAVVLLGLLTLTAGSALLAWGSLVHQSAPVVPAPMGSASAAPPVSVVPPPTAEARLRPLQVDKGAPLDLLIRDRR